MRRLLNHWASALFVLIIVFDQITKALVPRAWVTVDPATGAYVPLFLRNLYLRPITGAVLDSVAIVLLGAGGLAARRKLHGHLAGVGVIVLVAGMTSNLFDRLGLAAMTQGVKERGVVNWFYLGFGYFRVGNIADCCYVVGLLLIVIGVVSRLTWSIESTKRGNLWLPGASRLGVLGTALVLVVAVSVGWTGFWQGDRRAASASNEIATYRNSESATLSRLDEAVMTAYMNGDYQAALLLPIDQQVRCTNTPSWSCSVVMARSGPVGLGKVASSAVHDTAQRGGDTPSKS